MSIQEFLASTDFKKACDDIIELKDYPLFAFQTASKMCMEVTQQFNRACGDSEEVNVKDDVRFTWERNIIDKMFNDKGYEVVYERDQDTDTHFSAIVRVPCPEYVIERRKKRGILSESTATLSSSSVGNGAILESGVGSDDAEEVAPESSPPSRRQKRKVGQNE